MKKQILALLALLALLLAGCQMRAAPVPEEALPLGDGLTVHYIDVGQADCALLQCDGQSMLIDGGNRGDGQLVVSYLEQQGVEELAAVVCTHAHEDHVGGLPSVLAVYPTAGVYAPTRTYASAVYDDFLHYVDQQGLEVTIPQPGDSFPLGTAQVTVLGPVQSYPDTNNTSIVTRVDYGSTSFLFTGDMEKDAESDMLNYWGESFDWTADVLKVGHHGSDTSTGYRFLNAVDPDYAVISVGEGNSYGHPHQEPLSRLGQQGAMVLRTDELGHIVASSDGETVTFTWGNQSAQPQEPDQAECYIGNTRSHKFHAPDCQSLPSEKNQILFDTYAQAIEAGYSPCGYCIG